ncbi:MAG: helix-turn-helix domain-containing protein [Asticcacaulis sp.]
MPTPPEANADSMNTDDSTSIIEDEPHKGALQDEGFQDESVRKAAPEAPLTTPEMAEAAPRALGEILRSTRLAIGYDLNQVADITRVRPTYLEAIENGQYERLPSRSFAIGYVRAYARALRLDEETLAEAFKRQTADAQQTSLRAPIGAAIEDLKPKYHFIIGTVIALVGAVVVWNLFQRQPQHVDDQGNPVAMAPEVWAAGVPLIADGLIHVGAPLAAPKDQDMPVPYYTAGLEEGFAAIAAERLAASGEQPAAAPERRKAFNPRGAVYGAQPSESSVIIQAQKSVNLVVRGQDGLVYFARQMGAGEAYRVPQLTSVPMVIDVSDHRALDVFFDGEYAGELEANTTPISKINARAAATARLMGTDTGEDEPVQTSAPSRPSVSTDGLPSGPIPYQPAAPVQAPPSESPAGVAE